MAPIVTVSLALLLAAKLIVLPRLSVIEDPVPNCPPVTTWFCQTTELLFGKIVFAVLGIHRIVTGTLANRTGPFGV